MADERKWYYEKLNPETGKVEQVKFNDFDGKITGRIVFNVKAWFDENPEERKRLGWVKHIEKSTKDIEYNKQTQYLVRGIKQIDEWTVEDEWHIMDKSEEMMRLEELTNHSYWMDDAVIEWGGITP